MNKILIALVLAVVMSGNLFADAQSKCLKAVEKGKEIEHVNPDQDWRTGSATYKVTIRLTPYRIQKIQNVFSLAFSSLTLSNKISAI